MDILIILAVVLFIVFLFKGGKNKVRTNGEIERYQQEKKKHRQYYRTNLDGQELEKQGRIEEAIKAYEQGVKAKTDTPFTYRRLAILYRKRKDRENEVRVLESALPNIKKGTHHYDWFSDRLKKLND